jgi:methionine-gamma-lyase
MKKLIATTPESAALSLGYNPFLSEGSEKCPIFLSSTFKFKSAEEGEKFFALAYGLIEPKDGEKPGLIYSRLNHPNLQILEERLTRYEKRAADCAVFSSGLAAITTTFNEFLKQGDVLLCSSPVYGGTDHFLTEMLSKQQGVNVVFFDSSKTKKEILNLVNKSGRRRLKMIFIETPANPTNDLFDIEMLREIADHFSTKENKVLLAVDNTYLGPIWQSPLKHGADLVLYSLTKYVGGHSDLVAGACLGSSELVKRIKVRRTFIGNMSNPFDCWLLMRSLETLKLRMDKQAKSAEKIAKYLNQHPLVEKVYFLGNLKLRNKKYKVKQKQCKTNGAMIAFDVKGGKQAAFKFMNALKLASLAVSLGGTGTLVESPYFMTHAGVSADVKKNIGIKDNMVRYSVGVENHKDLIKDLEQAFKILYI